MSVTSTVAPMSRLIIPLLDVGECILKGQCRDRVIHYLTFLSYLLLVPGTSDHEVGLISYDVKTVCIIKKNPYHYPLFSYETLFCILK